MFSKFSFLIAGIVIGSIGVAISIYLIVFNDLQPGFPISWEIARRDLPRYVYSYKQHITNLNREEICGGGLEEIRFCLTPSYLPIEINLTWDTRVRTVSGSEYRYEYGVADAFTGASHREFYPTTTPRIEVLIREVLGSPKLAEGVARCSHLFLQPRTKRWNNDLDEAVLFNPRSLVLEDYVFVHPMTHRKVFDFYPFWHLGQQLFGDLQNLDDIGYEEIVGCFQEIGVWDGVQLLEKKFQEVDKIAQEILLQDQLVRRASNQE